jgi:hypothetical protein
VVQWWCAHQAQSCSGIRAATVYLTFSVSILRRLPQLATIVIDGGKVHVEKDVSQVTIARTRHMVRCKSVSAIAACAGHAVYVCQYCNLQEEIDFFHQQKGKGKGTRGWHGAQPRPASTRRFPGAGGAADSLHSVIASPGTSGVDIRSRDRAFDLTSIACAVGERATQPTACSTH